MEDNQCGVEAMKYFLDIDIGDAALYASAMASYSRAEALLQEYGSRFGIEASNAAELNDEEVEMLMEVADGEEEICFSKPEDIRAGRIVVELDPKAAPKACENFRCLVTGEKGKAKGSGKMMCYKGCFFHRIVKDFVVQGGDFIRGDGSAGESIYGPKFKDEPGGLKRKHDREGILGMANSGKNTNSSQFYMTLAATPKLDGRHVVFGEVIEGMDIIHRIDREAATADGVPIKQVRIADCGNVL